MKLIIKKGEALCISSGIYESYSREGPYVALRDFELEKVIEVFKSEAPDPDEEYLLLPDFHKYLVERHYVAKTTCRNIHLGDFGRFDLKEESDSDT
ncbi:hypothetical protein D3C76_970870 [compost metagenome]